MNRKNEIEKILKKHNIDYNLVGNNFMISCPFHEDKNPSFGISFEGIWHCFSCEKRGIWKEFLESWGEREQEVSLIEIVKDRLSADINDELITNQFLPSDFVPYDEPPAKVLERISERNIKKFGIGDAKRSLPGYFVIPIKTNNHSSYACRHLIRKPLYLKRWLFPKGFRKVLFPLPEDNVIILVEGLIGMMAVQDFGYVSSCCFGHHLTSLQIHQLIDSSVERVILLFDSYEKHFVNSIKQTFRTLNQIIEIEMMKLLADPDEITLEEFYESYENRISLSNTYIQFRVGKFRNLVNSKIGGRM